VTPSLLSPTSRRPLKRGDKTVQSIDESDLSSFGSKNERYKNFVEICRTEGLVFSAIFANFFGFLQFFAKSGVFHEKSSMINFLHKLTVVCLV
jgi:hypothetical protein